MHALIEALHWASLAAAAAFSFLLFRDLSTLGGRHFRSSDSARIATAHHRHQILATIFTLWMAAFLSHLIVGAGFAPAFWLVTAASAAGCIAGFVNPRATDDAAPSPPDQARE